MNYNDYKLRHTHTWIKIGASFTTKQKFDAKIKSKGCPEMAGIRKKMFSRMIQFYFWMTLISLGDG